MTFDPVAHESKWSSLPTLPTDYVVTDSDIEFLSDVVYMRTLVEDIYKACGHLGATIPRFTPEHLPREPWPTDHAAHQITAWRLHTHTQQTLTALGETA